MDLEIEKLPKDFFNKKTIGMLIALVGTGIGFFAGFPETPKVVENFVNKYPMTKWVFVYTLIWQGAGGYNESLSLLGTVLIYLIHKRLSRGDNVDQVVDEYFQNGIQITAVDNINAFTEMLKRNISHY